MAYTYRFYRFPELSDLLAAWDAANLPRGDAAHSVPGGAVQVLAPGDLPAGVLGGWYAVAAWPGETAPEALAPFEIPYQKGLPAFAGWRAENPAAAPLTTTDNTFGADPWSSIA